MKTSKQGLALIKEFEGFRTDAYKDVAGVWTIGYGFTKGVKEGDTTTKFAAEQRLARELDEYERAVFSVTGGDCTQPQFDALVSFAWNVGIKGMQSSSVIKAHKRGDLQAAARAFGLWNKAGGKVWPGLTRRRAAEAALYLTPEPDAPAQEMPQAVEPESKLTASPIVTGTTAATTLAAGAEAARQIKDIREGLGDWLPWALSIAALGLLGWVIWTRVVQRKDGWA